MHYVLLNIFLGILVYYYGSLQLKVDFEYDYSKDESMNAEVRRLQKNAERFQSFLVRCESRLSKHPSYLRNYDQVFQNLIFGYWAITLFNHYLFSWSARSNFIDCYIISMEIAFGIIFTMHMFL